MIGFARLCSILAAALTAAANTQPAEPVDAAAFARLPEYEMVKISPDGAHLAVALRREGRLALIVLRRDTLDVTTAVNFNAPNEVDRFLWVNPTRLLVSVATTLGQLDFPVPTGEIYAIDANGERARWLLENRAPPDDATRIHRGNDIDRSVSAIHILNTLPRDPDHILINVITGRNPASAQSAVSLLDVYNGRMRRLLRGPEPNALLFASPAQAHFVALARKSDLSLALHRRGSHEKTWRVMRQMAFQEGELLPLALEDSGRVWLLDSLGTDTQTLISLELDGTRTEHVRDNVVDIDSVLVDRDTNEPFAVRTLPDRPRYQLLNDSPLARHLETAMRAFPDSWLDITSHTSDKRLALVQVQSDHQPTRFYLLDRDSDGAQFLLDSRRWLDPDALVPTTPIRFTARDGAPLHGYLTTPVGTLPFPLLVLVHGGPHFTRDNGQFDEFVQYLALSGYAVLQINYRGSGGYGKKHLHAGFGHWFDRIIDDIADGVLWTVREGVAQTGRACVAGASFGGYAAMMSVIRHPTVYACAIGLAAPYDVPAMLERGDIQQHRLGLNYLRTVLGNDKAALEAASPVHLAARLSRPVLLGHGELDARVPIFHARRLEKALAKNKTPVTLLEFEGEAHGLFATANRVQWFEAVRSFLDLHIVASPAVHAVRDDSP